MNSDPNNEHQQDGWLRRNWIFVSILTLVAVIAVLQFVVDPSSDAGQRLGRVAEVLIWLVPGLMLAAVIANIVSVNADKGRYPPPGELVELGTHRLHLYCQGEARDRLPTIVLDSSLRGSVLDWSRIHGELAAVTRVCAYDRAGHGWSDSGPGPRTAQQMADELHLLLQRAGIGGPYVLVGEEASTLAHRLFAAQHRGEVAGLVFIEPVHEDDPAFAHYSGYWEARKRELNIQEIWARLGWLRLFGPRMFQRAFLPVLRLPGEQSDAGRALAVRGRLYQTAYAELSALQTSFEQVRAARSALDVPVVVISAGEAGMARGQDAHYRLARQAADGELISAEPKDRDSPLALVQPLVVLEAVQSVLARSGRRGDP